MEKKDKLLDKYYKGETTLEEENQLKNEITTAEKGTSEKDIFDFYQTESSVPKNLENQIFEKLMNPGTTKKIIKTRWIQIASIAASLLIILAVYLRFREIRNAKIENEFMVMEQALYQVSQSIQPEEQEDMLVLWINEDVEIIIN